MSKEEGYARIHRRLYKNKDLRTFWEQSAFVFSVRTSGMEGYGDHHEIRRNGTG